MKQTLSIFYFARFLDKREVFVHKGNKRLPHGGEDFTKTNPMLSIQLTTFHNDIGFFCSKQPMIITGCPKKGRIIFGTTVIRNRAPHQLHL